MHCAERLITYSRSDLDLAECCGLSVADCQHRNVPKVATGIAMVALLPAIIMILSASASVLSAACIVTFPTRDSVANRVMGGS